MATLTGPTLPDTLTGGWGDVGWVIGNYFWKARFVELDGFIHTGDAVQWNLATQEFVAYHPGETKPHNCGKCHTTGYDPEPGDPSEWPEGIVGTWTQPGVRCEACHGPGYDHMVSQSIGDGSVLPPGGKDCSDCHQRDPAFRMPWSGGFMRHHQQGEDFSHSPHADALICDSCHQPHKSVVYELGGMKDLGGKPFACTHCHPGNEDNNFFVVAGMENVECIDCHMPNIGKSATSPGQFIGDVRGHLFRIMTDPILAEDNVYPNPDPGGKGLFWNQDADGNASITLDYACLGCHIKNVGDGLTLEGAAMYAKDIHTKTDVPPPTDGDTWTIKTPFGYLYEGFTVTFEPFSDIIVVDIQFPDGESCTGIGVDWGDIIYWMDATGSIFFGNIDRDAGMMSGVAFFDDGAGIWFGEPLP